jgi:hypothetical protein
MLNLTIKNRFWSTRINLPGLRSGGRGAGRQQGWWRGSIQKLPNRRHSCLSSHRPTNLLLVLVVADIPGSFPEMCRNFPGTYTQLKNCVGTFSEVFQNFFLPSPFHPGFGQAVNKTGGFTRILKNKSERFPPLE